MVLDIKKHKELPVMTTVVDSASGVTLFTEDGKLVHRVTYTVRNTWKQFMEVALPGDAELWGAYVGGKSVKPTRNEKNRILIPLNRSLSSEGGLAPFDVELVYFQKANSFGWLGRKESFFAIPDLMMSRVIWSIYLPFGYSFVHFGGTMEKEKIARGISPLLGFAKRTVDYGELSRQYRPAPTGPTPETGKRGEEEKDSDRKRQAIAILQNERALRSDFGRNVPVDEGFLVDQLSKEMSFGAKLEEVASTGGMTAGVTPIRVQVPTFGQVYRFAKQIASNEPLIVEVSYVKESPLILVKVIILLLIIGALYRRRDWFRKVWDAGSDGYRKNKGGLLAPLNLVLISTLICLFSFFFLPMEITRLIFLIPVVAVIYYGVHQFRMRRERKREESRTEDQESL
jgi:hypothetical protein